MNEASKTNQVRPSDFEARYLQGRVIDIGASSDPVCSHAEIFDRKQGDANRILDFRKAASYDTVHSSHCLEHMRRPEQALADWWALVRNGGYMVLVVPEEDLYEQGSRFNHDHRATFTLERNGSWSPVSRDVGRMVRALPGAEVLSATIQHNGYDRRYMRKAGERVRNLLLLDKIVWRLDRMGRYGHGLGLGLQKACWPLGIVIDQTKYGALAQIEIIARKS